MVKYKAYLLVSRFYRQIGMESYYRVNLQGILVIIIIRFIAAINTNSFFFLLIVLLI